MGLHAKYREKGVGRLRKERKGSRRRRGGMRCAAREEGFKEKRVFANVAIEGVRRPSPGSLNEHGRSTAFSQCGGTACTHRLTGNGVGEKLSETCDEPSSRGDRTVVA